MVWNRGLWQFVRRGCFLSAITKKNLLLIENNIWFGISCRIHFFCISNKIYPKKCVGGVRNHIHLTLNFFFLHPLSFELLNYLKFITKNCKFHRCSNFKYKDILLICRNSQKTGAELRYEYFFVGVTSIITVWIITSSYHQLIIIWL